MRRSVALLAILFVTAGCAAFQTDAHVTSDTTWSGSFDGRTVDGTGNQVISLGKGAGPKCVVVQKKTRLGSLTVSVDGGDTRTTTAEFGVVSACGGRDYTP